MPSHTARFGFHLLDVRQALQPFLANACSDALDNTAAFELAQLAPQDFVIGVLDTLEIDVPDIGARIRLDLERERDLAGLGIRTRHRGDLREAEAGFVQAFAQAPARSPR